MGVLIGFSLKIYWIEPLDNFDENIYKFEYQKNTLFYPFTNRIDFLN